MQLIIKNSKGTFDITSLIVTVTLSGDYQQCSRILSFSMASSPTDKATPSIECRNGDQVTFSHDGEALFQGMVVTREKSTEGSTMELTCYDRGIYLKNNSVNYKFSGQTPEAITRTVCKDFGVEVGDIAATGVKITKNFLGKSLYDVIMSAYTLASESNKKKYIARFEGLKLCVREKTKDENTLLIQGGVNLLEASITESVTNMVNQVVITDSNDKVIKTMKNQEALTQFGLMQNILKQGDQDITKKAQKALDDGGEEQKITVTNLGDVRNITGNTVIVKEPYTGVSGIFYVDGDTHAWKNGVYQNKLVLNFKNIMDEKEAGSDPQKTSGSSGKKSSAKKKDNTSDYNYIYKPGDSPTKKG